MRLWREILITLSGVPWRSTVCDIKLTLSWGIVTHVTLKTCPRSQVWVRRLDHSVWWYSIATIINRMGRVSCSQNKFSPVNDAIASLSANVQSMSRANKLLGGLFSRAYIVLWCANSSRRYLRAVPHFNDNTSVWSIVFLVQVVPSNGTLALVFFSVFILSAKQCCIQSHSDGGVDGVLVE